MKKQYIAGSLLALFYIFSITTYAAVDKVVGWTQKTLLLSTAINYMNKKNTLDPLRANYTENAWSALSGFISHYIPEDEKSASFHSLLQGAPQIVAAGIVKDSHFFSGIPYWRISQSILVQELNICIDFTVLVIETTSKQYLIQSLDMRLRS